MGGAICFLLLYFSCRIVYVRFGIVYGGDDDGMGSAVVRNGATVMDHSLVEYEYTLPTPIVVSIVKVTDGRECSRVHAERGQEGSQETFGK